MISLDFFTLVLGKFQITDVNLFIVNLIAAVALLAVGIVLGKVAGFILKRVLEKAEAEKTAKKSFVNLLLTVIKWSIYILFAIIALDQLAIPQLTSWLTSVLIIIPALVGALLLIGVGFAIAVYLKDIVEESKVLNWQILSNILFYFVLYVFLVFALKTALISQDKQTVNIIIIIFTGLVSAATAYKIISSEKKK